MKCFHHVSTLCYPHFFLISLYYIYDLVSLCSVVFLSSKPSSNTIVFHSLQHYSAKMTSSRNVDHFMESIASSSTTRPNSPNLPIHNHIEYYLPGGDLFILVDNTLFRIHSYFFRRESQNWRNLLGTTTTGRMADAPLILNDEFPLCPPATPSLFTNFLWVFYNPRYSIYEASSATW